MRHAWQTENMTVGYTAWSMPMISSLSARRLIRVRFFADMYTRLFMQKKIDCHTDIYCAGSAVMSGHEGFWLYQKQDSSLEAMQGYWNEKTGEYLIRQN